MGKPNLWHQLLWAVIAGRLHWIDCVTMNPEQAPLRGHMVWKRKHGRNPNPYDMNLEVKGESPYQRNVQQEKNLQVIQTLNATCFQKGKHPKWKAHKSNKDTGKGDAVNKIQKIRTIMLFVYFLQEEMIQHWLFHH